MVNGLLCLCPQEICPPDWLTGCSVCARRVRKLRETLVTVQQLDKNMSNLRTWLSRVEDQLNKPVVYSVCHSDEIQKKLAELQVRSACSKFCLVLRVLGSEA